jgi:hypothetical protein
MPIEVKITFTTGPDSIVRVMNDVNNQIFAWYFNRQPSTVSFDPGNYIILKTATLTQIPPIPVELTSFSARQTGDNVLLEWTTASELNNQGFEIERMSSSEPWQKIGFVQG